MACVHVPFTAGDGASSTGPLLHGARGLGEPSRFARRLLTRRPCVIVARGRESPRAADESTHADAVRFGVADAGDLPLAGVDELASVAADAGVGVGGAGVFRGVQRLQRQLFDERFGARRGDERRGEGGGDWGAGDGATTGYGCGGRGGPEEISTIDGHRSRG